MFVLVKCVKRAVFDKERERERSSLAEETKCKEITEKLKNGANFDLFYILLFQFFFKFLFIKLKKSENRKLNFDMQFIKQFLMFMPVSSSEYSK